MFRIERALDGQNWVTISASPHRLSLEDLKGPQENSKHNFPPSVTQGNKSCFTGKPGAKCRIRYEDTAIEQYEWDKIPVNEFDPDSDTIWGWKLVAKHHHVIPVEKLWPLNF